MIFAILLIISLVSFFLVGIIILNLLKLLRIFGVLELLSLSFGIGVFTIGIQIHVYSIFGIQFDFLSVMLPWLVLFLFKPPTFKHTLAIKKIGKLELSLMLLILSVLVFVGLEALIRPLMAWDGIATWLVKSKAFYVDNAILPQTLIYLNDGYPLVLSSAGAFIYKTLGGVNDRLVLILYYGFYAATGGILYASLRRFLDLKYSLLLVFLYLATQNILRHGGRFEAGYADLAFGYFIFASTTILFKLIKYKSVNFLLLFVLFLGACPLIKEEGSVFSFIMTGIFFWLVIKKYLPQRFILMLMLWILPIFFWRLYKIYYGVPTNYILKDMQFEPSRIFEVVSLSLKELFNIKNWNMLWFVFIFSFLFKSNNIESKIAVVICALLMGAYIGVYLISPNEPSLHVPNTMNRLLLHVAPLAILLIGKSFFTLGIGLKKRESN